MAKRRAGISTVTLSHIQGGREVSSVTLTGEAFAHAAEEARKGHWPPRPMKPTPGVPVPPRPTADGFARKRTQGAHVVAREIAVAGQVVVDDQGDEFVVVTRSADGATLYARERVSRVLHRIRVRDGLAQCIEVR